MTLELLVVIVAIFALFVTAVLQAMAISSLDSRVKGLRQELNALRAAYNDHITRHP